MNPVSLQEYENACDNNMGWCNTCCEFTADSCEPDAREYECPECGDNAVYGAEEALLQGMITIE